MFDERSMFDGRPSKKDPMAQGLRDQGISIPRGTEPGSFVYEYFAKREIARNSTVQELCGSGKHGSY